MTHPDRSLTCPKCHGAMRAYERSGVTVDECSECRGIFLDRGELERLIDADAAFYARATPSGPPPGDARTGGQGREHGDRDRGGHGERRGSGYDRDDDRHADRGDLGGYGRGGGEGRDKRKRGGFLSELFD